MKLNNALKWLVSIIILLTIVTAAAGLFWQQAGSPSQFTTLRGETVDIYGQGLYRYDTVFFAAGFRGTDAVTLIVAVPLLLVAFLMARRGSLRGALLLAGALSYPLYYSASLALGAAYNPMLLVYILLFSASLFAFVLAMRAIQLPELPAHFLPGLPQRALTIFLYVSGIVLFIVWMMDLVGALAANTAPALLDSYTTMVTFTLDLGIITPAVILTADLIRRRQPFGYLLAAPLLTLCALIGLVVIGQTVFQINAGIVLSPPQMAIFVGSFVVMTAFAIWILVRYLGSVSDKLAAKQLSPRAKKSNR